MIGFILYLIVSGLVAGYIARELLPDKDDMSAGATVVLGIVGSFIGGLIGYALTQKDSTDGAFQASGILGSVVGAVIVLLVYRALNRRGSRHLI